MEIDSKKVADNLMWRFAERFGAQGITLIVTTILARVLEPSVYGIIAIVNVILNIVQVFVDSGLGTALIQKKDADQIDFSSVFIFNLITCVIIYTGLFLGAPFIETFYDIKGLKKIIRVLGITVIISGLKNVQQSYVSKNMIFEKFFFATLVGTVCAGIVGILMAISGFGVWALVVQNLVNHIIDTIILWFTVKWRPRLCFSYQRLKILFSFGFRLLLSSLLTTINSNLCSLIIGKKYSSQDLGFFNRGQQFPSSIINSINSAIDSVLLPSMAMVQDDKSRVKSMVRRAIKTGTYIIIPAMIMLAVCSKQIVILLLTEKWIMCVPFLQIFCLQYMFYPIHTANLKAIEAVGRSDVTLKIGSIKRIQNLIGILISLPFGPFAIAISMFINSILSLFVNNYPNRKLLNYSIVEQIKDILPQMLLAFGMGVIIKMMDFISISAFPLLLLKVIIGSTFYLSTSYIFKIESFNYAIAIGRRYIKSSER